MTDILLQSVLSNLLISSVLALVAWIVQRSGRSPVVANVLWTVVLIKMITPPIWTLQLIPVESLQTATVSVDQMERLETDHSEITGNEYEPLKFHNLPIDLENQKNSDHDHKTESPSSTKSSTSAFLEKWIPPLAIAWIAGSIVVAMVTGIRLLKFNWHLRRFASTANPEMKNRVDVIAKRIGLAKPPRVLVSPANASPFCWFVGGEAKVVLSTTSIDQLNEEELQMVIAHEVAHLKRKDHWVRLLECLATIVLWWNPVMWWARKQLRITEEMACDALVLEKMNTTGHAYAHSLLRMTELLSTSAIRPPTLASAMTSGGKLEKRLKMIIQNQKPMASKWNFALMMLFAVCIFPLGLVYGQDMEAVKKRLAESVKAGEITKSQAGFMLEALELSMKMKSEGREKERRYNRVYDKERLEKAELERRRGDYARALEEYERAAAQGKISKREAEEKAIELRKDLFGDVTKREKYRDEANRKVRERELAERKEKFVDFMRDIESAVQKGDLSKRDAERKLNAVRKELFEGYVEKENYEYFNRVKEIDERKEQFNQIYKEIEQAVQKGDISKEEAQEKLIGVRKKLFAQADEDDKAESFKKRKAQYAELEKAKVAQEKAKAEQEKAMAARKQKYAAAIRETMKAAESGKVSKKDAERKIAELKKALIGASGFRKADSFRRTSDMEKIQSLYERQIITLEEAIAAGKLSKEDGKAKANALRKKLFEERRREENRRVKQSIEKDRETRDRALEKAAAEFDAAIKAGLVERQEGLRKLEALKREYDAYQEGHERALQRLKDQDDAARKRNFEEAIRLLDDARKSGKIKLDEKMESLLRRELERTAKEGTAIERNKKEK